MRAVFDEDLKVVHVRLSRRNIENLLHMLDDRDKIRPALSGRDNHFEILVEAQENDEHYVDRPAGSMSWESK
jgi:hypothetical protein